MIEIDGSALEGGGQILRTAVAMSCITGKAFRISDIRKGRPNPGLKQQHLVGLRSAALLYSAKLDGDRPGSMHVSFSPGQPNPKDMKIDVGTAGSVTLVLQTLLPVCLSIPKPVALEITGGTHVEWSPPMDYLEGVLIPVLEKMGAGIHAKTIDYGFYPKGGGKVSVKTNPCSSFRPVVLTKSAVGAKIHAVSIASEQLRKAKIAERQLEAANAELHMGGEARYVTSPSPGSCIHVDAVGGGYALGSSCLGQPGKPAESVGKSAALGLKDAMSKGASVDAYLADQLIPYMALAKGTSRIICPELSRHAETNIWVVKKFLDVEFATEKTGQASLVSCFNCET